MIEGKVFTDFFIAIQNDARINVTHIAIFAALYRQWLNNNFENPIRVFSYDVMPVAKLSSSNTYHRKLRELHEYGYIHYEPSFKRNRSSKIYLGITEETVSLKN